MGVKVERKWVVFESVIGEAINPEYLSISEEDVLKYMEENPMPVDPVYSKQDLIHDVCHSSGMLTLMDEMNSETREYVAELIGELL